MAIRTLNKYKFLSLDSTYYSNEPVPSDWLKGLFVSIDNKSMASKKLVRRICFCCGNVDDSTDATCTCGNDTWNRITIGQYRKDDMVYEKTPHLDENGLFARCIKLAWSPNENAFLITEQRYELLFKNDDGFWFRNYRGVTEQDLEPLFLQYIQTRSEWQPALALLKRYPIELHTTKNNKASTIGTLINYANILKSIPSIETVSPDLFLAIFNRYVGLSIRKYENLTEFYKHVKAPLSIQHVYPLIGLSTTGGANLDKIDQFEPCIIRAISYALVHRHVQYSELDTLLSLHGNDIDAINAWGIEFAEFFRKNIVKYGGRIYDAFLYIKSEYNSDNIKDANIKKFARYAGKKGIKSDKVAAFADNMYEGNALAALQCLL